MTRTMTHSLTTTTIDTLYSKYLKKEIILYNIMCIFNILPTTSYPKEVILEEKLSVPRKLTNITGWKLSL